MTRLKPAPGAGRTTVETLVGGRARALEATTGILPCRGTGKLEAQIAQVLRLWARTRASP